jgi:hypothetical protein
VFSLQRKTIGTVPDKRQICVKKIMPRLKFKRGHRRWNGASTGELNEPKIMRPPTETAKKKASAAWPPSPSMP